MKKKKKKLVLPKRIRVGGLDYKILSKGKFQDDRGEHWGFHSYAEATIRVLLKTDDSPIAECSVLGTLFHELCHAIDFVYCNGTLTESMTEKIGDLWFHLLSDNNFHIREDKLPKSIKILGKTYKMLENYNFEDCTKAPSISVNPAVLEIKCDTQTNYEVIKVDLMDCVMRAICHDYFFTEDEKERINVRPFCSGLYQVLKDSKLDDLIREWC